MGRAIIARVGVGILIIIQLQQSIMIIAHGATNIHPEPASTFKCYTMQMQLCYYISCDFLPQKKAKRYLVFMEKPLCKCFQESTPKKLYKVFYVRT